MFQWNEEKLIYNGGAVYYDLFQVSEQARKRWKL